MNNCLLNIINTEKTAAMPSCFCFLVYKNATKATIKKDVEKMFDGVKVKSVNVLNSKPCKINFRGKPGVTKGKKKAYVFLSSGIIDVSKI